MQHKLPLSADIHHRCQSSLTSCLLNYSAVPKILDCGYCLIGGVKFVELQCRNIGVSAGTFCIIPKNQWPVSNLRVTKHAFNKTNSINVATLMLTCDWDCLGSDCGANSLFRAGALRCGPVAVPPAARRKRCDGGEPAVSATSGRPLHTVRLIPTPVQSLGNFTGGFLPHCG